MVANGRTTISSLWSQEEAKKEEDDISKGGQVFLVGNNWGRGDIEEAVRMCLQWKEKEEADVGFWGVLGAEEGDKELMLVSGISEGFAVDVDHLERNEIWAVE